MQLFKLFMKIVSVVFVVCMINGSIVLGVEKNISEEEIKFYTSFESDENNKEILILESYNKKGTNHVKSDINSKVANGPNYNFNTVKNKGWIGDNSLEVLGTHYSNKKGYGYTLLYDNLDIEVDKNTVLSYVIFPDGNDKNYDFNYNSSYIAIDLKFKDGSYLSELNAIDQNENIISPLEQGKSRTLVIEQWNYIKSNIGDVAKGKIIEKILVGYQCDYKNLEEDIEFSAFIDDIKIYNEALKKDKKRLSDYVNILRGTNNNENFSRGLTVPAIARPHGFNFIVPTTNSNSNLLYEYQLNGDKKILKHISISHEPSYWIGDRGTWQFMINTSINIENVKKGEDIDSKARAAEFNHSNEIAKAHYYSIKFDENSKASNSEIELTATEYGGMARFSFSEESKYKNVILDCERGNGYLIFEDNKVFKAYSDHVSNGMKRMYIYGEFNKDYDSSIVVEEKQGIVTFPIDLDTVEMKFATSFISFEQAKKNLELEITKKDNFNDILKKSQDIWDRELGRIEIEGATENKLINFYSSLYRVLLYPNIMSENVGTKENPKYCYASPYEGTLENPQINEGIIYINNGFWDTYRSNWSLFSLLTVKKNEEMLNGIVQHYIDNQWIPRWIAPGAVNSMVGTNSDIIFADAINKGMNFNKEEAFQSALKNGAVFSDDLQRGGRMAIEKSNFLGYVPWENKEGLSWSLEGYLNDYGISKIAKAMGKKDEEIYYKNRALNYTKLFNNSECGWFVGKKEDGSWRIKDENFDPISWGGDYTETNGWNMAFSVVQDGEGLANLYGGRDKLAKKLDGLFNTEGNFDIGAYGKVIHEMRESRAVKLGQYGHSNQPSHHIIYMYNYAAKPWKTQELVRDVLDRCYIGSDFGQGYIGDEDNGEMSSWYIFSSLGFYPVSMGNNEYAIGSPLFKKVTINLENGKKIIINAPNNNKDNKYIKSMKLNGKKYGKSYISYDDIKDGAEITFNLDNKPNKKWANDENSLPSSLTKKGEIPKPMEDLTVSNVRTENSIPSIDSKIDSAFSPEGDIRNLFDNNSLSEASVKEVYYYFKNPTVIKMYTITSGNEENSLKSFKLLGSNDDENWNLIDSRTDEVFKWKRYTRPFLIETNKAIEYKFYKLEFDSVNDVAEIEFIG